MPPNTELIDQIRQVQERLLAWYAGHGRDLPWRRTRDPYAILVAEVMLQQTGVERVLPKYHEFLDRFPSLADLAAASRADVIRTWAPLGYNRRAVRLHEIAQRTVQQSGGRLPSTRDGLRDLPGIGGYSAGAIACFAFGDQRAFLDTNIRRVLGRIFLGAEPERTASGERRVAEVAEQALPSGRAYPWHQALMDLGATLCRARDPRCLLCPVRTLCRWADSPSPAESRRLSGGGEPFIGSSRYYRGRIVDRLRSAGDEGLDLETLGTALKSDFSLTDHPWLADLLRGLEADGLVKRVAESAEEYRLG